MNQTRRALVLTDEAARHPFRQSLPPHWRESAAGGPSSKALSPRDWRGLLAAYCAAFLVTLVFIA